MHSFEVKSGLYSKRDGGSPGRIVDSAQDALLPYRVMTGRYCPKCLQSYSSMDRVCPVDQELLSLKDPYHLVGQTLMGKYRVDALMGIGGMGAVYYVEHLGISRRVAFKILQPNI